MATQNIKVRSGNRIAVMLDGQKVGLIRSLRASDDYSPEPASGIGDIHVKEYVPTMARHTISVSEMVLEKASLRDAGIIPENGDAALQGLVFDVVLMSKDTGEVFRSWRGCSFASGDIEVTAHQIVSRSAQLNVLDVSGTGL